MGALVTAGQRTRLIAMALVAVAVCLGTVLVVGLTRANSAGMLGDLDIYRGAISYAFGGGDLYGFVYVHPTVHGLGFTYPPFAALVLAPFALLDSVPAKVIWTGLTFAVALGCLLVLVRQAGRDPSSRVGAAPSATVQTGWVAGLAIPLMLSYPFLHNLVVGQVSLFVVALALCDQLLPRRWQGAMVGLGAAIKLTPLVFLPYYLITRQWRQAATCGGVFAGASALAFAVLPNASITYWTDKLWETGRVGRTESTVNKSLLGTLSRQLPAGVPTTLVWLVVAALVAGLAYWRAARYVKDGNLLAATLAVGALSVAVSPISWPHHQLWLVLAGCWWLLLRGRVPLLLGIALLAVFVGYPWFDDYPVGTVSTLLGVGIELPALAVLVVLGVGLLPGRHARLATPVPSAMVVAGD